SVLLSSIYLIIFFFFSMTPPPPSSTLFPYTTLFRSVVLLGSNGAGKSTLNNTLCGLCRRREGTVRFDGQDLTGRHYRDVVRAGLIQVPEGRRVFPNLSVRENLELGSFARARARRAANLEKVLDIFPRLRERLMQLAGTMSGGEQQMLAIGRGLMAEPRLL